MKYSNRILVCLTLVLSSSCGMSKAAERRVGSNQPYSTIGLAIKASSSGDIIVVHDGTYVEEVTLSKTGLSLVNAAGESPILQGKVTLNNGSLVAGLKITSWSQSGYPHGIFGYALDNVTISNCAISSRSVVTTNLNYNSSSSGIYIRNCKRAKILNNRIFNCNKGLNIVSAYSPDGTYQNGTIVSGNTITGNVIDGIDLHGQYVTLEQNVIADNIDVHWQYTHPDGIQFIPASVDGYGGVQHCIVRRNLIRNQTQNVFVESGSSISNTNLFIYSNVVYNDPGVVNGVEMDKIAAKNLFVGGNNVHIYNNTFGRSGTVSIIINNSVDGSVHFKNNIVWNGKSAGISVEDGKDFGPGEFDYNCYFENPIGTVVWNGAFHSSLAAFQRAVPTQETHGFSADPKLGFWPNVTLAANSPCLQTGVNLGVAFIEDFAGKIRPTSSSWDIGAYGSGSVPIESRPLPASNLRIISVR